MFERVIKGTCQVMPYAFRYHEGFLIINQKGEHIAFTYETAQQCCEEFMAEWHGVDGIESFYGLQFENPLIRIDINEYESSAEILISDDSKTIGLSILNIHEGYYSHMVTLADNGELVRTWEL